MADRYGTGSEAGSAEAPGRDFPRVGSGTTSNKGKGGFDKTETPSGYKRSGYKRSGRHNCVETEGY